LKNRSKPKQHRDRLPTGLYALDLSFFTGIKNFKASIKKVDDRCNESIKDPMVPGDIGLYRKKPPEEIRLF